MKLQIKKKTVLKSIGIGAAIILLAPGDAKALDLFGSVFNQMYGQLQNAVNSQLQAAQNYLQTYAQHQISTWGQQANQEITSAIQDSIGALGLPDIFKVLEVAKKSDNPNSIFNPSESAVLQSVRGITGASAYEIISQQGQEKVKKESDIIAGIVQDSSTVSQSVQSINDQAQNDDSTQDVVKRLAAQNAELSKQQAQLASVSGSVNQNLQTLNKQQAVTNINLDQLNQTTAGQTQRKNYESLSIGRENYVRASRARLF